MNKNLFLWFIGLLIVAAWVDEFDSMLENNHHTENPMKEIPAYEYAPKHYNGICPHTRGQTSAWIECRERISR